MSLSLRSLNLYPLQRHGCSTIAGKPSTFATWMGILCISDLIALQVHTYTLLVVHLVLLPFFHHAARCR